ncbi:MAG: ATP-binding protein [Candidatus Levybacteria bacterium]|nr:ATP-binding protein [Candidatus Levybacteria bacterium]
MKFFNFSKKQKITSPQTPDQPQAPSPVAQTAKPQELKPQVANKKDNLKALGKGMVSLVDIISPSSVEVDFNFIRVGEKFHKTFFVVDYPRYVSANWLSPLIDFDHELDISMFIYPTSLADTLSDLRRKIAEMEATISSQIEQGQVVDPKVTAGLEDALSLQEELAKSVERFFMFSLYVTLTSDSLADLDEASKNLFTSFSSILLVAKTTTLQMEEGFKTSLPMGQDRIFVPRNMDTTSLASTFPFTSTTLTQDKGILYGINQQNGSLIIFDRFSLENANEVVLGKSGVGKSYLLKLEILRQFMFGTEVIVVDPEGEYENLTRTLNGEYLSFTPSSPIKINPFDLSGIYEEGENELGIKILSLHGLLKVVLGSLDSTHDAILDRALVETYRQKGITADPSTQTKEPPLMEDFYKTLLGMEDPVAKDLAFRLEKFIKGSLTGIFNQQSNLDIKNPLTVFSIKTLEEELRPIAMHIILDFVWTRIRRSLKKRLLILDEAWYMMKHEDSASFVYGIAKRARKYYLGLTTATQDVEDFLSTDYGKAVLSNSSLQVILKQGTNEVDLIAKTFYLSEGEKELLLSANIGEGLFFAGQNHVAIKVVAAPFEHEIITSNPAEISGIAEEKARQILEAQDTVQTPVTPQSPAQPTTIVEQSPQPQAVPTPSSPVSPVQPQPVSPADTTIQPPNPSIVKL